LAIKLELERSRASIDSKDPVKRTPAKNRCGDTPYSKNKENYLPCGVRNVVEKNYAKSS
tara:strand:+ start:32 stop:208 length:177 start_codon:yes stop_codon:yes gene_type:complete